MPTPRPYLSDQGGASLAVLQRLLGLTGPDLPALLCDVAWNMLAWNQAMAERIADPAAGSAANGNAIMWLFTEDAERIVSDLGRTRNDAIGQVHLALARHPGEPGLERLVSRIRQVPETLRLWDRHHISDYAPISPRRMRSRGSDVPCKTDLLSMEFPGGLRLLVLVPRSPWPTGAPPGRYGLRPHRMNPFASGAGA